MFSQPPPQVGVGYERSAKGHQVGPARRHGVFGHGAGVAVVDHPGALEVLAQRGVVEGCDVALAAGLAFNQVQVGQVQRRQALHGVCHQRLRVTVGAGVVAGRHRRQPHARAAAANGTSHRLRHFQQQPAAVGDAAAVSVAAVVDAVAQELVDQVAVGGVDLDAVETGRDGIARSLRIVGHHACDFFAGQRARWRAGCKTARDIGLAVGRPGGAAHRRLAIGQQRHVRDAAHVPQLHHDAAALGVHVIGDAAPAGDLPGTVDARRVEITLSHRADLRRLGDDQPGPRDRAGALRVVGAHQLVGHLARAGAVARQRRHHEAGGQGDVADANGVEQGRHGCGCSASGGLRWFSEIKEVIASDRHRLSPMAQSTPCSPTDTPSTPATTPMS